MIRTFSRRRFLAIIASGAVMSGAASAATASWRGRALGAEATITLGGIGRATAEETFAAIAAEISRLEEVFSLFRVTSALSRLNRDGYLDAPPADLVALLKLCDALNAHTNGAFDPTIQPVWQLLADGSCVSPQAMRAAIELVGWSGVDFGKHRVRFARTGMAITLNGVAQGYVTDRVADLLRARGFENVLIDMGEIAALGQNHGHPWLVGVATSEGYTINRLALADRSLAVSSPLGTSLCRTGHILEPRRGASTRARKLVAVSADRAAVADGLSTACCLLSDDDAEAAVATFTGARLETLI